jgi:fermentation-respiration switch protein FrsA (DUF1100 family)
MKFLAAAAAAYGLLMGGFFLLQGRLLYFPVRALAGDPASVGLAFEDLRLTTADGVEIHGWFVPAGPDDPVVLFFHGNAENISHRLKYLRALHDLGLGMLMIDYRGYGLSGGRPTEAGTYRDAAAAWRYLREDRGIPAARIVLLGYSLGGAVAAELASWTRPGALVLESTFTSIPDIGAHHYPFLPVRLLTRFRYPTEDYLARVRCPVLIIHSPDDRIVPFSHGQALLAAAPEPKALLRLSGGHNEGHFVSGDRYAEGLMGFLQEVLPPP